MPEVAAIIAAMPEEDRSFFLRAYPQHEAAAGNSARLGELIIDPGWLEAQRIFDPSLLTYLQSLAVAIRSVEVGQPGERGPLLLMVLSLLESTARTTAGNLPDEALQVLSQGGRADQARDLAMQRPTPWERSDALLGVARVESGLGNRTRAAESLAMARQEAAGIAGPAGRCRAICAVLRLENSNQPDDQYLSAQISQLCDLADTIADAHWKMHAYAELADMAREHGLTALYDRCAAGVQRVFTAAKKSLEQRQGKSKRGDALSLLTIGEKSQPLDHLVNLIDETHQMDQPVYLLAVAKVDSARLREETGLPKFSHPIAPLVASLLRAAASQADKKTIDRLAKMLLAHKVVDYQYETLCSSVWDTEEVIEALAEVGQADVALTLIGQALVETADVADLRKALARGAGRRGDLASIERAAGRIAVAARTGTPLERLGRVAQGAKQGLGRTAGSWLMGMGVSGADVEKIEIYLEGYQGLLKHDPRQAGAFLEAICQKMGTAGEKLIRRILVAGMESLDDAMLARIGKLITVVDKLPWARMGEAAELRVEYWLERSEFEKALAVAAEVSDPNEHASLVFQISRSLIEAGQLEKGLALAETITAREARRQLYQAAMSCLAGRRRGEASAWVDRITGGLGKLEDADRLAASPALPALAAVIAARAPAAEARGLLEPLGSKALLACCEPLAGAMARNTARQEALATAQTLLGWLEGQPPSVPRIRAACALARGWAPAAHLSGLTRRAYDLALGEARGLKFATPVPFTGYTTTRKKPFLETSLLAELATAARCLHDRQALLDLWEQAQKAIAQKPVIEDNALIEIAAGLAGLGETLRYDGLMSFPPYQAINYQFRPLAHLEIVHAMADIPPEQVYRARKGKNLSAGLDWVMAKIEDGAEGKPAASWSSYRAKWAEEELASGRDTAIKSAIKSLPELPKTTPAGGTGKVQAWQNAPHRTKAGGGQYLSANFLSLRTSKGDARLWLRMIAAFATHPAYPPILRVVLAAQGALESAPGATNPFGHYEGISKEELDAIVDAALAALIAGGKAGLANDLAQLLPEQSAGVRARLAATAASPQETEKILAGCIEQGWSLSACTAIASTAAGLPDKAARRRILIQLLRKARANGRQEVLQALGALIPLAGSILPPADLFDAAEKIIANESYW